MVHQPLPKSISAMDALEIKAEQEDPAFQSLLRKSKDDAALGQTITLDEFDELFGFDKGAPNVEPLHE